MLQEQTKEIGGRAYTVRQLPAMKAARLLARLGRVLSPAITAGLAGLKGAGSNDLRKLASVGNMDVVAALATGGAGAIAGAFQALTDKLTEQEFEDLIRALLASTFYQPDDGKQVPQLLMPQFDLLMQGRMADLFQVLAFAFEVNYGNFFGVLAALLPAAMLPAQASPSPSESQSPIT